MLLEKRNVCFYLTASLLLIAPGVLCASSDARRDSRAGIFNDDIETVCYGRLGCLTTTDDWYNEYHRWINLEPQSPDKISTTFTLYARENMQGEVISVNSADVVNTTIYSGNRKTKFIIHGFLGNAKAAWVLGIMEALLKREDANVITVDWSKGAKAPYNQAAVNTRVVGLEIAYLAKVLLNTKGGSADDFHLIGHSLGAHTSGYAGERIAGLGRITGLDPAGPWFTKMPTFVRLDPSDAKFVDIIHTDAEFAGFGIEEPCGHVDFFPNGGYRQPGCKINLSWSITKMLDSVGEAPSCSHSRSELLFLESIKSSPILDAKGDSNHACPFVAFLCDSYEKFLNGSCIECGQHGKECALMGLDADTYPGKGEPMTTPRKFFLKTSPSYPFCGYHYTVKTMLPADYKGKIPAIGDLVISAYGDQDIAEKIALTEAGARKMLNGTAYNFLGFSPIDAGNVTKAEVTWRWQSDIFGMDCMLCVKDLSLSKMEVTKLGYYPGKEIKMSSACKTGPIFTMKNKVATSVDLKC